MSVIVCVGCGLTTGHLETCAGGGYAVREELAAERGAEQVHEHEHWRLDERVPGCDYCLLDPPSLSVRVSDTGRRELDEARERYRQGRTALEQYDAERSAIIAAHPYSSEEGSR
jgi:hypothetical protein